MVVEFVDVVVVGGASAALSAAVAARQGGANRVLILEKSPQAEAGGNARFSHTGFRFVHSGRDEVVQFLSHLSQDELDHIRVNPYTSEEFAADLSRVTEGRIDPEIAETMVSDSNEAMYWMLDMGFRWELQTSVTIDGYRYVERGATLNPEGGGKGQVAKWIEIAKNLGVETRYDSKVTGIIGTERSVTGVVVSGPDGVYEVEAKAVILAAGGYQANAEKRARYLGQNADLMVVRGSRHNTGEVMEYALDLGAKAAGHWQWAHSSPIASDFPRVEPGNKANRYSYQYGITVNGLGQRFYDEGEAEHSFTYAKTGWAILKQPGAIAYQIYDKKTIPLLKPDRYEHSTPLANADTIEELADQLGIAPQLLIRTIEQFNAAVQNDHPLDVTCEDGRSTKGLEIDKSNWAQTLDAPPFVVYGVTTGITFSFGGLEIDTDSRVINQSGNPIHGLYGSGDILGIFFHNYPSCSGQTRNIVFGRRAGRHAAALVTKEIS